MQTTTPDLAPATAEVGRIVAGVRDDQPTDPTPCPGTSVAGMLDHLLGLTTAFRMAAEKVRPEGGPSADAANLAPDWRIRLPAQLDALAAAWRPAEAWEGITEAGGVELPASAMGVVALDEVVVHGWDLAAATGQQYRPDESAAQRCLEFGIEFEKGVPDARSGGLYGPKVDVPADAPVFDRLLGHTGRDPGWRP